MSFTLSKPRLITYRDYKKFNINAFRSEIQSLYSGEANLGFFKFGNVRPNEAHFMTKVLHVAFMKRSRLTNKFLRDKNQANRDNCKIQGNLCKKPLRKPNNLYLPMLILRKSLIILIELFIKQLFLSLQTNRQKVKLLLMTRVTKAFPMKTTLSNI